MIDIPAQTILNAIECGGLEEISYDGSTVVLLDLQPIFTIPQLPVPQISNSPGNCVTIRSGGIPVARIAAQSSEDAERIADWLADLLAVPMNAPVAH